MLLLRSNMVILSTKRMHYNLQSTMVV